VDVGEFTMISAVISAVTTGECERKLNDENDTN
jgi:hypothetical protein